jgi:hypothetical protein
MKKVFALMLFALQMSLSVVAQTLDVCYKPYEGHSMTVIKPTINNFISLLSLSETQFESTMKRYKYFEENSDGKYRTFWNGSLDNFTYAMCVNTYCFNVMQNEIRFMVSSDMIYPADAMTSLYRSLRPYYKTSGVGTDGLPIDLFSFKKDGFVYSFYIRNTGTMFDVTVTKTTN